ncbi:STE/STE7/MEK1 protein kinase [Spizellomyces punctatus DAOM BR117]|uniref:mitogen-activated protein kinase kinase n=1 Tax=Spizellomyces punctatus (strain DAOM BR117) TaxID=645134 RepID=A0A0L0HRJ5_SPIPD|nr:STE/STE7/MEK1 protein kinase [Spizellomyces punctatus DAOM BR117]KND03692.1 STE/STE7/MEK1 protein kinase [Spizellomyces punctatus DAOM BR117]|eukprot:XP_016611731.1 STE/STE7/MEK1 protein kinase [Spizellomyces punctatus DAOM BR117]
MSAPAPATPSRRARPRPVRLGVSPINLNGLPPHQELESPSGALVPQLAELSLPQETKLDLKNEDIDILSELGAGNGGTVHKVKHVPTGTIMARKVIHVEAKNSVRRQIVRELQIMHKCNSPYIVSFYGAFLNEGDISICMEYMNLGSLDNIYKKIGPIPEDVVGKVTHAVLAGLVYLYMQHRIIHRDVKPSNILLDSAGHIKIADFGVSGQLINSVANTFVGTSAYMSPERIQGGKYSVQSDVWSLGITLMELALGKFPFPPEGKPLSVFELLEYIVNEPVPTLPAGQFSEELEGFIGRCLIKDPAARPTPSELLKDPYCRQAAEKPVDVKEWAKILQDVNKG